MTVRIVTWNTFFGPTMFGRVDPKRWERFYDALHKFDQMEVDVLFLQELHHIVAGPISWLLYMLFSKILVHLFCYAWSHCDPSFHTIYLKIMNILDFMMLAEAHVFPFIRVENNQHLLDYSIKNSSFKYVIQWDRNTRYKLGAGLVILSRWELNQNTQTEVSLPSCWPIHAGLLSVSCRLQNKSWVRLINVHLVPDMDASHSFAYTFAVSMNKLLNINITSLRQEQLQCLAKYLSASSTSCPTATVLAGDFNVSIHSPQYFDIKQVLLDQLGLQNFDMQPHPLPTVLEKKFSEGQIDFVMSNSAFNEEFTKKETHSFRINDTYGSDHYPVLAIL